MTLLVPVAGETAVMQRIMGSRFILHPAENPFGYASTFVPPGANDPMADFSRGRLDLGLVLCIHQFSSGYQLFCTHRPTRAA